MSTPSRRRTRGRPSKYTPECVQRIVTALQLGAPRVLACHYAGISEDTFANWLAKYADFSDAVTQAEAAAAIKWLARIEQAADAGTWKAAAWKLEQRFPHLFGKPVMHHAHDGQITVVIVDDHDQRHAH